MVFVDGRPRWRFQDPWSERGNHAFDLSLSAQAIANAEEEAAKKKVGSAAALKQLDKLRKEAVKSTKEADKTSEELAARKEEHKVCNALTHHSLAHVADMIRGW